MRIVTLVKSVASMKGKMLRAANQRLLRVYVYGVLTFSIPGSLIRTC